MRLRCFSGRAAVAWGRWLALVAVLLAGGWARAGPAAATPETVEASDSAAVATEPDAAGDDPASSGEPAETAESKPKPTVDWEQRAARLEALIDGSLDPNVDANALFSVPLDELDADGSYWAALQQAVDQARDPAGSDTEPETPASARGQFVRAMAKFLALEPQRQVKLLEDHEARQTAALREADAEARRSEMVASLTAQAELMEALRSRTLDPDIDPLKVLEVDLRVPGLFAAPQPDSPVDEPEGTEPANALEVDPLQKAHARLQQERAAWLALEPSERGAILKNHAERKAAVAEDEIEVLPEEELVDPVVVEVEEALNEAQQDADEAEAEQEKALEAARRAKTEALRRVKEEKARLLGIKREQALFAAELTRRRENARLVHESMLEWTRKVEELRASTAPPSDIEAQADRMYPELREVRATARDDLRDSLARLEGLGSSVPRASLSEGEASGPELDNEELQALRSELSVGAERLVTQEAETEWEIAASLRDDAVAMNKARLELLAMSSQGFKDRVTGLSADGFDQVRREFDEIVLELRYHARALPRDLRAVRTELTSDPVGVLWVVVQLLVIMVVFRAWRRRADDLLRAWHGDIRRSTPAPTLGQRTRRRVLWYLRRIRKPLEWLLLLLALPYLFGSVEDMPELRLGWLILAWWFGGLTVIQVLDALAERQSYLRFRQSKTATLRLKSLRLLGVTVTIVGLLLTVTADIVGRGAIYEWVLTLCWLLLVPITLWLVVSWRTVIFERIVALPRKNRLLKWIEARQGGAASYPAAGVGGVYLFIEGLRSFVVGQAGQLDTTRRVLAYLFRREVAKQAEARSHRRRLPDMIPDEQCEAFNPEGQAEPVLKQIVSKHLDEAVEIVKYDTTTLTAVVGERGMGKTTFLNRLLRRLQERTCLVDCPPEGFEALLKALATEFEAEEATEFAVAKAIGEAGASTICIDDAQRMVEPTIGGLEDIDQFTRFALRVGGDVSWVVGVDRAAWQYLNRARGERVFFDQVIELPRWNETEITELIRKRTAAAQIHPSFEELVVATQFEDGTTQHDRERTELGYHRILWDYSSGNPAVALLAWRHSLFVSSKEEEPVVQLFEQPSAREIEKLPLTLLFVLRGVVQLDLASESELASCTQLPLHDVADAIRFSITHGYLERLGDRVRVTWIWYRTITTVLARQHLLVS